MSFLLMAFGGRRNSWRHTNRKLFYRNR